LEAEELIKLVRALTEADGCPLAEDDE